MRTVFLSALWTVLASVYVATVIGLVRQGHYSVLVWVGLSAASFVLLFFGEGFEIAFAMLWPVRDSAAADVRTSLEGLDPEFILAQRQVIVVLAISVVTLTSAFESLHVPGVGTIDSRAICALYSGLFTTLSVLWFAQVLPKRVAAKSPERFWRLSRWLLKLVAAEGRIIDLPGPCDYLVALWDLVAGPRSNAADGLLISVGPLWAACDCAVCAPTPAPIALTTNRSFTACGCGLCGPTFSSSIDAGKGEGTVTAYDSMTFSVMPATREPESSCPA
jgi:hypothetical protein